MINKEYRKKRQSIQDATLIIVSRRKAKRLTASPAESESKIKASGGREDTFITEARYSSLRNSRVSNSMYHTKSSRMDINYL